MYCKPLVRRRCYFIASKFDSIIKCSARDEKPLLTYYFNYYYPVSDDLTIITSANVRLGTLTCNAISLRNKILLFVTYTTSSTKLM